MIRKLRYLLLQVRNPGDPMRENEIESFAKRLGCDQRNIKPWDLIGAAPSRSDIAGVDAVLVGGSGDYSVVSGGPWLPAALETFRQLHDQGKPTFASCWGFQAFAKALGGEVVTDLSRAEVGTYQFQLTEFGEADPVFGPLGNPFSAQVGHQDIVDRLPEDAELLCSTTKVRNHAFTFRDLPIYATQFHPELELADLLQRLRSYPEYVANITGLPLDQFEQTCYETPGASDLLSRFVSLVFE